jgi:3-oxoadipate enol-lactonase
MRALCVNGVTLHVLDAGDPAGARVMFANSLGTDLRLWDARIPLLPTGQRLIRYDKRGHGLSECPEGPYSIDILAADAIAAIEGAGHLPCVEDPAAFAALLNPFLKEHAYD